MNLRQAHHQGAATECLRAFGAHFTDCRRCANARATKKDGGTAMILLEGAPFVAALRSLLYASK